MNIQELEDCVDRLKRVLNELTALTNLKELMNEDAQHISAEVRVRVKDRNLCWIEIGESSLVSIIRERESILAALKADLQRTIAESIK